MDFDIKEIIKNEKLVVFFQPIGYISKKAVVGVEGLVRGIYKDSSQLIPPSELFNAAAAENLTLELDRLCREKVIDAFSQIYINNRDKLLFINIDASVIERVEGSNYLKNQVKKYGINPGNIVIEINEAKVKDISTLERFINNYRQMGFLIALDDIGSGFSNLDRISIAKPNIIKADISLVRNIQSDFYKQEVFKSIVSLSSKIGSLVVAEGAESEEEAINVMKLGAHMIQGFYFSKPVEFTKEKELDLNTKIEGLNRNFKKFIKKSESLEKAYLGKLYTILNKCITDLMKSPFDDFDRKLSEIIEINQNFACAYILDENGIQVSDTIRLQDNSENKDNPIFYSAIKGNDHSIKSYYYHLKNARLKKYVTDPYISLASGNICITISKFFINKNGKKYILCMDFEDLVLDNVI